MPPWEQGVALALSLQGRASTIAQSIDHNTLAQQWGLAYLVYRLEEAFGKEFSCSEGRDPVCCLPQLQRRVLCPDELPCIALVAPMPSGARGYLTEQAGRGIRFAMGELSGLRPLSPRKEEH